jgi:hypothetical protein
MAYIGAGITRFNTADELTVTGTSEFGGNVSFGDNDITNVGSLQIDSIAGDADTNTNITFAGSDVITMTTAGSERLRVDASGNLGVGTSSPDETAQIFQTATVGNDYNEGTLKVGGSSAVLGFQMGYHSISSGRNVITSLNNGGGANQRISIGFGAVNSSGEPATNVMTLNQSGNVGIGAVDPNHGSHDRALLVSNTSSGARSAIEIEGNSSNANGTLVFLNNGSTSCTIDSRGTGTMTFNDASAERMRISSGGGVNIGGTGAQAKFEVNNAVSTTGSLTDTTINLATTGVTGRKANIGFGLAGGVANTNAATIGFDVTSGSGALQGDLFFSTRGSTSDSVPTERMRIESGGNIKISDKFRFTAGGDFEAPATGFSQGTNSKQFAAAIIYSSRSSTSASAHIAFYNSNGEVGTITTQSSSTAYNTSSDHRLKEAVVDMTGAIDRVKALAPKRFNFIADPDDTTVDGFLAHEAQAVVPEAVTGTHNEVDENGDAVMQGIDQSKLVPLLTAALKESIAKIETLETKVAALEGA